MLSASKNFFVGFLSCAILSGFIMGIYAQTSKTPIQALLNNSLKLKLKGEDWLPKDPATGENYSPITYNGRTYLPLRAIVTDAAGMPVDFDSSTDTVWIGGKSDSISAKDAKYYEVFYGATFTTDSTLLSSPLKNFQWGITNDKDLTNQYFSFGLIPTANYQNLRTSFYLDPDVKASIPLNICKNDFAGEIMKTFILEPGKLLENIDLNLSGANKIYFSAKIQENHGSVKKIMVGEPIFYNGTIPSP